jgi:hypothetical protein
MEIPIQDASTIKSRAGCGQTKHQKYGAYLDVLKEKPDILTFLFEQIDKNPSGEILVKAVDMGTALGPYFEKLGETAIHWGLKFAFFNHGIFVSTTKSKETNPNTGTGFLLLRLRRAKPDDELSEGLAKYMEPPGEPDPDAKIAECPI